MILVAVATFAVAGCSGPEQPAPTVTVTSTATVTTQSSPSIAPAPATSPSSPQPQTSESFDVKPEDFVITLHITKKKCFGSAGCNLEYRVATPEYRGTSPLPDTGEIEVIYEIRGGEHGPAIDSFTIQGDQVWWSDEGDISTASSADELTAVPMSVSYENYFIERQAPAPDSPGTGQRPSEAVSRTVQLGETVSLRYFDVSVIELDTTSDSAGFLARVCYAAAHPDANADGTTRVSTNPWSVGLGGSGASALQFWRVDDLSTITWPQSYGETKLRVGECNEGWVAVKTDPISAVRYAPRDFGDVIIWEP
ncbi:hypothetical protein [Tessaracoccus terricola]